MIKLTIIIALIWLHYIADFLAQTDDMAINKSTSNYWLGMHVMVYTVFLLYLSFLLLISWKFAIVNGIAHFVIDWCTSRGTSYLWKKDKRHWFFSLIGFDQALHLTVLVLTYAWLA